MIPETRSTAVTEAVVIFLPNREKQSAAIHSPRGQKRIHYNSGEVDNTGNVSCQVRFDLGLNFDMFLFLGFNVQVHSNLTFYISNP